MGLEWLNFRLKLVLQLFTTVGWAESTLTQPTKSSMIFKTIKVSFPFFLFFIFFSHLEARANPDLAEELDLDPEVIENSPVLQKWGDEIPNVLREIRHDPSFKTRVQFGVVQYPSSDDIGGFKVGVEDIFLGETGLTANLGYSQSFNRDRAHFESNLAYSLLPMGNYFNVAPIVGYHSIETEEFSEDGVNVGLQLRLTLSRTGAADLRLTQSFISPGQDGEVGLTTIAAGYSVTEQLRLGVEIQKQNSSFANDSRVGILSEWQFR